MITPTPACADFCNFLLSTPFIKLTSARKQVVIETRDASNNQTALSNNAWNNFLLVSWNWYEAYIVNTTFAT